eukprot:scaffold2926_cov399-Prasinococcus_capsulatus_cf.AAC.11
MPHVSIAVVPRNTKRNRSIGHKLKMLLCWGVSREWDRYAKAEYIRLSMEEGEENQAAEMWDDVPGIAGEAPF